MGMQVGASAQLSATEGSQLAQAYAEMQKEEASGEDSGVVCMVCKEGYATAPRELLGAYCFCMAASASDQSTIAPPPSILSLLPASAGRPVRIQWMLVHHDSHSPVSTRFLLTIIKLCCMAFLFDDAVSTASMLWRPYLTRPPSPPPPPPPPSLITLGITLGRPASEMLWE